MGGVDALVGVAVVDALNAPPLPDPVRQRAAKSAPKWEADGKERLRNAIRRFARPLLDLQSRDANEGDTRLLVTDMLCDGLGYDKYTDLTTEYAVKGEFADYGIRIDKQLVAFVEVKRVTTRLDARHLRQVEMYAVNEGVEWVILTNGISWRVYHITGSLPVEIDLAFEVDLQAESTPAHKADQLFYISRESLKRRQIDAVWKAKRATSPRSLAQVLLSPVVLFTIQKELKKQTAHNVDADDVAELLRSTILRPECLDGEHSTAPIRGRRANGRL
jgi:hypothetical protein